MFVQDDWYHLYHTQGKTWQQILNHFNLWQSGQIDPLNFYRPLSTKLYFFLAGKLFGLHSGWYRLVNVFLFAAVSFSVFRLAKKIAGQKKALAAAFFYLFNLANFTFFSYITKAEDLFFALFAFLSIKGWLDHKKPAGLFFFILSLMCRESALIIPGAIAAFLFLIKKKKVSKIIKDLLPWLTIASFYFLSRQFIYGWPQAHDTYQISLFGSHLGLNLVKYLQWNLNITALLKEKSFLSFLSLFSLAGFFIFVLTGFFKSLNRQPAKENIRSRYLFCLCWWFIFLFPVVFFADHRDPWNLAVASFGLSLFLSLAVHHLGKRAKIISFCLYFFSLAAGLLFYRRHHWTASRARLVKETASQIKKQCSNQKVVITAADPKTLEELRYAWYFQLGTKVFCANKNLKTIYQLE